MHPGRSTHTHILSLTSLTHTHTHTDKVMTIGIVKLLKLCYTLLLVRLLVLYNELAPVSSADQVISVPLWKFCRPWVTGYNDNVTCYLVVPSVPRTVSTTGHCIHVCIHV